MKNGSYFIPREQIHAFMNPGAMNNQEGLYIYWETDPAAARRVLPPQLDLVDPAHPIAMVYVVNIREPTFAPWYMEGGLSLLCRYGEIVGVYFLNLQLSGPGAQMGLCSGRESAGLPKKMCERIVVERNGDWAQRPHREKGPAYFLGRGGDGGVQRPPHGSHAQGLRAGISGKGRLPAVPVRVRAGARWPRDVPQDAPGPLRQRHRLPGLGAGLHQIPPDGAVPRRPVGRALVVKPLGAGYSINSNWVAGVTPLAEFEGDEADSLISYLFSGRWDRSTLVTGRSQRYGQF